MKLVSSFIRRVIIYLFIKGLCIFFLSSTYTLYPSFLITFQTPSNCLYRFTLRLRAKNSPQSVHDADDAKTVKIAHDIFFTFLNNNPFITFQNQYNSNLE